MGATENLSPEQIKAIEVLVATGNKTKAARAASVDRSTLYRWLKEPPFQAALKEVTQTALQEFSRELVRLTPKAVKVLEDAMGPKKHMSHRLRAAAILVNGLMTAQELIDIRRELDEIRREVERGKEIY